MGDESSKKTKVFVNYCCYFGYEDEILNVLIVMGLSIVRC